MANAVEITLQLRKARAFQGDAKKSGAAVEGIGRSSQKAGKQTGVFRRETDAAKKSTKQSTGAVKNAAKAAIGLGAAYVGIGAAKKAVSTTIAMGKATLGLSRNLGLSTKSASEWAAVANVRGIDMKQLNMGFTTLSRNSMAARKGSEKQAAAFRQLGLRSQDVAYGSKNFNYLLRETIEGLGKLPGGTRRAAIAQTLFGKSSQKLLPLMKEGNKTLDKDIALANKYGATLNGKTIKSVGDLAAMERELKFAQLGAQVQFSTKVMPTIIKGVDALLKLAAAYRRNKREVRAVAIAVGSLVAAFKGIKLARAVGSEVSGAVSAMRTLGPRVGRALRSVRSIMRRVLFGAGTAAGDAAASSAATSAANQIGPAMGKKRGKFTAAGRVAGRAIGAGVAVGFILAVPYISSQLGKGLMKATDDAFDTNFAGMADLARRKVGDIFKSIVPGTGGFGQAGMPGIGGFGQAGIGGPDFAMPSLRLRAPTVRLPVPAAMSAFAAGGSSEIVLHTHNYMDGRKVGESIRRHALNDQARQ